MIRHRRARWSLRLVLGCVVALGALALSWLEAGPARAVPPIPSVFWGAVWLDGTYAPPETIVSAWSGGRKWAETVTIAYEGVMMYVLEVPGDDSDTAEVEGPAEGTLLQFQIRAWGLSVVARETAVWQNLGDVRLDLTGDRPCVLRLPLVARGQRPPGQH